MKVFIYKNGLCDPAKKIGTAIQLPTSKDVDEFVHFFVASIDPKHYKNWRIFVTNDTTDFAAVDHYVLMDDNYGLDIQNKDITELPVVAIALEVNVEFAKKERIKSERKAKTDKFVEKLKGDQSMQEKLRNDTAKAERDAKKNRFD